MNITANSVQDNSASALQKARLLELPTRDAMLRRLPSVAQFWKNNTSIFVDAWQGWEASDESPNISLDSTLLDAKLVEAVQNAWSDPNQEGAVKDLWTEVCDGVYQAQFFNPNKLADLRAYLEATSKSDIPTRPPYGIALNRNGAMLDERSQGYLAAPAFQAFYNDLQDKYMRPIARLLFPEIYGFDSQTFGFSIQYQPGMDTSLQAHTDASAATLNINMNLPDETFTGSQVDFYNRKTGDVKRVSFTPGTALIHRGNVPHAAHPIISGTRSNMVLWLYGEQMQQPVPHPFNQQNVSQVDAQMRWNIPKTKKDNYAPF